MPEHHAPDRALRLGVCGPVGTGKRSLIALLCRELGARAASSASSPTTSTPTRTRGFLRSAGVLDPERICAVETGACPHTAIRDDITANLLAVEDLERDFAPAGRRAGRVRRRQPHRDLLAGAGRRPDLRARRRRRRRRGPQGRAGHRARRPARRQQDRPRAVRRRRRRPDARRRAAPPATGGRCWRCRAPTATSVDARCSRGCAPRWRCSGPATWCRPTRARWRRTVHAGMRGTVTPTRGGTAMTITPTRTDVCSILLARTAGGRVRVTSGGGPFRVDHPGGGRHGARVALVPDARAAAGRGRGGGVMHRGRRAHPAPAGDQRHRGLRHAGGTRRPGRSPRGRRRGRAGARLVAVGSAGGSRVAGRRHGGPGRGGQPAGPRDPGAGPVGGSPG